MAVGMALLACFAVLCLPVFLPYGALLNATFSKVATSFIWFNNFTLHNIEFVFFELSATKLAVKNTFLLGAASATIGTIMALVIAYVTTRRAIRGYRTLGFLATAPVAIVVTIELGAGVQALDGANEAVTGVRLADGRVVPCDAVLIGVGGVPNEELAKAAGIDCDGGIVVDLNARTSDPDIFAIGDCTKRPLPLYNRTMRLESVPNALEQAKQAASAICGRPQPAPEVPWFWSDQYDLRLQIVGIPFDATEVVVRGDIAAGKFALFHLTADGTVQAVEAVNASTEFMGGRRIIQRRKQLNAARIADLGVTMQELAS